MPSKKRASQRMGPKQAIIEAARAASYEIVPWDCDPEREEIANTPSYKTNDPRGWCGDPSLGAALGRPGVSDAPRDVSVKLVLRRVRIDQGGYDPNGTYFGIGRPIYWYANDEGTIDGTTRADNREHAKSIVRSRYPNARFYR